MSKSIIYQILKELGGKDVHIRDIVARIKEKYPNDKYMAERAGLKLYRLHKSMIVSRYLSKHGRGAGFVYTIISDYE